MAKAVRYTGANEGEIHALLAEHFGGRTWSFLQTGRDAPASIVESLGKDKATRAYAFDALAVAVGQVVELADGGALAVREPTLAETTLWALP